MEGHTSVMPEEVMRDLAVAPTDTVIDATIGGAGHFSQFFAALGADGVLVGIDADPEAVERARTVVAEDRREARPVVHLICDNFRNLSRILDRLEIGMADKVLFDLGWSSYQLTGRGLSFKSADEPLLMTYGEGSVTAAEIVNSYTEEELSRILWDLGEERFARKIAKAIVAARKKGRILTAGKLAQVIEDAVPVFYKKGRIHPATKTFQALRIAANDELGALREGLAAALSRTGKGGKVAVLSFHSIEDRIVKEMLRAAEDRGEGEAGKALPPSRAEVVANRRSRSAKLRIFEHA